MEKKKGLRNFYEAVLNLLVKVTIFESRNNMQIHVKVSRKVTCSQLSFQITVVRLFERVVVRFLE